MMNREFMGTTEVLVISICLIRVLVMGVHFVN